MYEEAIASMGKDLANLEAENGKLRKSLVEANKEARSPFRTTTSVFKATSKAVESSLEIPPTVEATTAEIQTLRNALKLLREENDRLKKGETARHLQALLPSLPILTTKPVSEIAIANHLISNLIKVNYPLNPWHSSPSNMVSFNVLGG
jgi:regulator of replication initiation timing